LRDIASAAHPTKLRVVYVDHVARMSGGEIALLRLLPYLRSVEPHVILGEDGPLVQRLGAEGISVEVLPMPSRAREQRKDDVRLGRLSPRVVVESIVYAFRLARRLRALQPDIVHTNSLKAGVYGSVAAKLARVPVLWHVRDRIASDYLPTASVRFVRFLVRHLADIVVANSQATLDTLEQPARGAVVYSVVPEVIPASRVRAFAARRGPTIFGMVGRVAPWKGQDVFVDAFARAFPGGTQRAVVVGDAMFGEAEQAYAAGLGARARALGVHDRVEFRGFRNDVWAELESVDVLVHASRTPEPFGQVVLEGMAAGVAVVATAEGGPRELITDGRNGILYPAGDVDRLAEILTELDVDASRRRSLGEAAQARARDFLPEPIAERLEGLYESMLRERRRG